VRDAIYLCYIVPATGPTPPWTAAAVRGNTGPMSPTAPPAAGVLAALALWALGTVAVLGAKGPAPSARETPIPASLPSSDVSFRRDVMQVLNRAGCNAGPCHGNANGKGGFKLSLRGEDPVADLKALALGEGGRRVDLFQPEQSLLLLKATATLAHEGGRRFPTNSWEYSTLHRWITSGATEDVVPAPVLQSLEVTPGTAVLVEPLNHVQIRAVAVFADGTRRDVTTEAVYEPTVPNLHVSPDGRLERQQSGESVVLVRYLSRQEPVRVAFVPARPGYRWQGPRPAGFVDEHVFAKLRTLRLNPSPDAPDSVWVRRVYLDLLGLPPTAEEARAFVADRRRDKRARCVDALLERPEFADYWALKWADLLRVDERPLDRKGLTVFHRWIRDALARNQPMDQFARELVSAQGSTYAHPPANFHRSNRTPVDRALAVSEVFLGTRLNCAQCHNHPFDRWSQDDYHDWAAVFARVNTKVLRNDRRDENDSHEFKGEQVVYLARQGEVKNPRTGRPAVPRLLGTSAGPVPTDQDPDELRAAARWLTAQPQFSRVMVNRIWFHLLGRGLVDPVDDFRATNPASHPELLQALADDFVKHGHDLRQTIRRIVTSRTYGFDSQPDATNGADEANYSHTVVRRLGAEVLADCQAAALGARLKITGQPEGTRAVQLAGAAPQQARKQTSLDRFLATFGKPPRLLTCECERSDSVTMSQAFQLVSGPLLQELLTLPDNRLGQLAKSDRPLAERITELYWSMVSRAPSPEELSVAEERFRRGAPPREVFEDLAWSLINAKEFVLRR
jgi:hypothetical protein